MSEALVRQRRVSARIGDFVAEFERLDDARAFINGSEATVARLPPERQPDFFLRLAAAYDQFPELEAELPPRVLAERLRRLADALPERASLGLLLLCAAWDPAASVAQLLGKAAAAGLATLLPVLRLLRDYREFDWDEFAPAFDVLRRRGAPQDAAAALGAVLDRVAPGSEPDRGETLLRSLLAPQCPTDAGTRTGNPKISKWA